MKRLLTLTGIVLMGIFLLMGCSKEEASNKKPIEEDEPIEEEAEEEIVYANYFPLTGIGTNEDIDHRPVAVTINNDPAARPQSGLNEADIVYEVLAEGGVVTRFLAIYHSSKPENIGPVRSARGYHIDLTNGYNAFFITHGWSPEAHAMLEQQNRAPYLQGLYYDGIYFKRSSDRRAPHNSYITFDNIEAGLESRGYDLIGDVKSLAFMDEEEIQNIQGTAATEFSVQYGSHTVAYEFDESTGKYVRSSGGTPTEDYVTGEPVALENVFVVVMSHTVVDDVGRLNINLNSGGQGYLFQNGIMQEVQWDNIEGRILPVKDGQVLEFIPGQTWINIIRSVNDLSVPNLEE